MARAAWGSPSTSVLVLLLLSLPWPPPSSCSPVVALPQVVDAVTCPVPLVTRENRKTIASTESGTITSVDIDDGHRGPYHLQFFTLEPRSLLLPLLLHADMVFYVHTGRGTVNWVDDEGETYDLEVESGDVYRIGSGSVLYMRSHADPKREKLRVHAIFGTLGSEEAFLGPYSDVTDLVRGFDEDVLRMGFRVPAEVISGLKEAEKPPPIVPLDTKNETETGVNSWKLEGMFFEALTGGGRPLMGPDNGKKAQKKKKEKKTKTKAFNIAKAEPDVENCNGRSIAVTDKDLDALSETDIGVFMVKLTKGAMMGPHWNSLATEIAVVTHGRGMVQLVRPSVGGHAAGEGATACRSLRFRVDVGDVFLVPRYHPMAQMSFNDAHLSLVGFSTRVSKNHPQFLAGKRSVLQTLNKGILALSLGVPNTTVDRLLAAQEEAIMLECTSCAEEEEKKMGAEIQRQKEEAAARKREEEEEAARREEEKRKRQEEKARKREEEEAREREEEAKKREEEERKRQEEDAKKREEEETYREKEEDAKKREEEERRRQQEEEEERRRKQEEEEEARRQERARRKEEEATRGREEEEERRRQQEEEEEEGAGGGGREIFKPWRLLPIV